VGWLQVRRLNPALRVPSQVLDEYRIGSLQCLAADDLHGVAASQHSIESGERPPIYALKFCPVVGHENILGMANEDGNLAFQHIDKPTPLEPLAGLEAHENAIFDFAWCPSNAARVVTVSGDQTVATWDIANGEIKSVRKLRGHNRSVKCVDWRPGSDSEFATGSRDNSIMVWDTRSNSDKHPDNIIRSAHTARDRVSSDSASVPGLVWLDHKTMVSVGANDGVIKVWDMRKNYSLYKKDPIPKEQIFHPGTSSCQGYTGVLHSPFSPYIYVSCLDQTIYKYDIANAFQSPVSTFTGAELTEFYIKTSLSHCGNYLASGSGDHKLYMWNTGSPGGPIATLGPHEEKVTCVAWGINENILASCTDDMRHRIWRPSWCTDPLEVRGRASMTGKRPPPVISPVINQPPSTPSRGSTRYSSLRTPVRDRKLLSSHKSGSKLTPSIKSFLTPKNQTPKESQVMSPLSSSLLRGKKRRLIEEEEPAAHSPPSKLAARGGVASSSAAISELLKHPASPVKCTFSPATYRSPNKLAPSPRKSLALKSPRFPCSPVRNSLLDSPLRCEADRRPLETLSPTANLPNLVRDGVSPARHVSERPARRQNWLTAMSIEKKKADSSTSLTSRNKTPKSKKKIGYK